MLSFQDIGAAAMLSRATAGTIGRSAVFVLPGSEAAVRWRSRGSSSRNWDTSHSS